MYSETKAVRPNEMGGRYLHAQPTAKANNREIETKVIWTISKRNEDILWNIILTPTTVFSESIFLHHKLCTSTCILQSRHETEVCNIHNIQEDYAQKDPFHKAQLLVSCESKLNTSIGRTNATKEIFVHALLHAKLFPQQSADIPWLQSPLLKLHRTSSTTKMRIDRTSNPSPAAAGVEKGKGNEHTRKCDISLDYTTSRLVA